ncbi:hypothetical protein [Ramlibacter sp.]|uniref:hypothetical protein n=1 Tax=Ramlibacter sp. TaxID=1917967 RepID=UPI0018458874|nr:hypothetical protein [Ramlibacter sp.]MBA2673087.1 hypothetical protein [Ramlibacter sp.]
MNRLFSAKSLAMATVVLGGVVAATAAQARSDVVLSIGVNAPYGYVQPQPVYVQPRQVYVQPQTVYYSEPQTVYYNQPQTVYYGQPQAVYYGQQRYYGQHRRHGGWDRDGDGVADRYDRAPNNPYRY